MANKKRVVVLGAGPAGLSTAWQLSEPELRESVEVTVYQVGWRAGGQCATGRVGEEMWVNQNGTHYIFGCYHQSRKLLRLAYEELKQAGEARFGRLEDQLVPRDNIVLKQLFAGTWTDWVVPFPLVEAGARGAGVQGLLHGVVLLLKRTLEHLLHPHLLAHRGSKPVGFTPSLLSDIERSLEVGVASLAGWPAEAVARGSLGYVNKLLDGELQPTAVAQMVALVKLLRRLFRALLEPLDELDVVLLRWLILVDLGLTVFIGALEDQIGTPQGLALIDKYDVREWLERHGALPQAVYSPPIQTWYDAIAAFRGGDGSEPIAAAGASLVCMLDLVLDYEGSVAYQLQAEIGDSFIGPIVAALRLRGVRFAFFHRVWDIVPGPDGEIASVVLERQAEVKGGPFAYDPFVAGTPAGRLYWPDDPQWDRLDKVYGPRNPGQWQQLVRPQRGTEGCPLPPPELVARAPAPQVQPALDSAYYPRSGPDVVLRAGQDYDLVVAALRHTMYPSSAPSLLAASDRWSRAVERVGAAETQSLRVWFRRPLPALGWLHGPAVVSNYTLPYATWEDPSPVLETERWPEHDKPAAVGHLFGPLAAPEVAPANPDFLAEQGQRALFEASVWARNATGTLWPRAASLAEPQTLCSTRVVAVQSRPNSGPDQRYTMILPGTARFRLSPAGTGYPNLVVCGDWTRTRLLTGSLEGAVDSGREAASAALTALQRG